MKDFKKSPALEILAIRLTSQKKSELQFFADSVGMPAATFAKQAVYEKIETLKNKRMAA